MKFFLFILVIVLVWSPIISSSDSTNSALKFIELRLVDSKSGELLKHYILIKLPTSDNFEMEKMYEKPPPEVKEEPRFLETFRMRRTVYVKDKRCILNVKNPITASGTKLQKGVAAINVVWDKDKKKWVYNSPLRMGDRIYIEGYGEFVVRDTGTFNRKNKDESYWTIDLFMDITYEEAREMGVELVDVHVISRR